MPTYLLYAKDQSTSRTRESEESTIPNDVGWKALQERLELTRCAGELKLLLEPCCGDTRAIGKRMARLDPGRAVFVGEIADVLAHTVDGDAVDDASDDRIKAQGREELADVVDGELWDRHVRDGGGWDRGGLPVGREESREIAGKGGAWDGDDGGTEGGVVVEEGEGGRRCGSEQDGLVFGCRGDDGVIGAQPFEQGRDLGVVRRCSEGGVDGGFLDPDELLAASWQRHGHRRRELGHTGGLGGPKDGLLAVDAIEAVRKTRRDRLRDDVGVGNGEENSGRGHRVQRRNRSECYYLY